MKSMHLNLIGVAALLGSGLASAATVSYTHVLDVAPLDGTLPTVRSFSLPTFNSSLGTLTGVELIVSATATETVKVQNTDTTSAITFTSATATTPVNLFESVAGHNIQLLTENFVATYDNGGADITIAKARIVNGQISARSVTSNAISASSSKSEVLAGDLSSFIGNGVLPVSFVEEFGPGSYSGIYPTGEKDFIHFGGTISAGSTTEIIYTYTATAPVPEPEQWLLMLSGLSLVYAANNRKKSI